MWSYVLKRLLLAVPTLVGMSALIFILLRLAPGNIADVILTASGSVDPADKRAIEAQLGLDRPVAVQYWTWVTSLVRGDLGYSYRYERPASDIILSRLPTTFELAALSLLLSLLIGIPAGIASATRQDSWIDYCFRIFAFAGLSLPGFWLGLLLLLFLVRLFSWTPEMVYVSPFEDWRRNLLMFIWPTFVVGYRSAAVLMRLTRSSMLDVLREEYVRTAWAKGLKGRVVIVRHALSNAILPVITYIGVEAAFLLGGLAVVETVFNLPGVALYLVDAIRWRDYPVAQSLVMYIALVVIFINLAVDVLYAWLEPRVRYA
ncbi:MAG: ABC transporter permease [Chloroflexi bacterium]|nr:ABC transporter permease [Chloroflexota bacterium]